VQSCAISPSQECRMTPERPSNAGKPPLMKHFCSKRKKARAMQHATPDNIHVRTQHALHALVRAANGIGTLDLEWRTGEQAGKGGDEAALRRGAPLQTGGAGRA
jgi:hypothetical protein